MAHTTSFGRSAAEGEDRLTYGGYLQVRELTGLQRLLSTPSQHDELLFIVIHQTYELWFKQTLHELGAVMRHLNEDQVLGAQRLLGRCIEIQRVLVAQLSILETMTPVDFLTFRDHLAPASGFQSAQYREIEYLMGLKDARFLKTDAPGSPERTVLERRLAEPTLRDAFFNLLRRRGFDLPDDAAASGEGAAGARAPNTSAACTSWRACTARRSSTTTSSCSPRG